MKGEVSTGLPGKLHQELVAGFVETQQADPPATMDDFRLIAEWVKAGGLHYLASSEWMTHLCKLPVVLEKATSWRDGDRQPIGKERGPPSKRIGTTSAVNEVKVYTGEEIRRLADGVRK